MRKKIVIAAIGFGLIAAMTSQAGVAFADHDGGKECEMPDADAHVAVEGNQVKIYHHVDTGPICAAQ